MPKLVVLTEELKGRTYELKVDRTTVGRVEDNAFQIAEPSVSSHHCEVLLRGNDVVIKDLNSTNGTFINGQKIVEEVLKPGQTLRLGQIDLRLEDAGGAAPPGKKRLDQTRIVGVKLDELDQHTKAMAFDKDSPFAKKSNKASMIFLVVGIAFGVIILGALVYALVLLRK